MTPVYINGMANISPAGTWDGQDIDFIYAKNRDTERLMAREPDYAQWIDARQFRRMSRILKMGVAAGFAALKEAGVQSPDAIMTGTGYGCLEDTGLFLGKMTENHEEALNPTPFIQSTHNTIGSQIALHLGCQGYNQTYAQGAFSFEHALLDAMLYVQENPAHNALAGGVDEITDISYDILKRFGNFQAQRGVPPGEGAAYFALSAKKTDNYNVVVRDITTLYKAPAETVQNELDNLLQRAGLRYDDIHVLQVGASHGYGSAHRMSNLFPKATTLPYKNSCGEYPTASAFGFWAAVRLMTPVAKPLTPVDNVLVWNQYADTHQSLILLTR